MPGAIRGSGSSNTSRPTPVDGWARRFGPLAAKLLRARVEDRPLIRVVAEQTAQPKMGIALETVAPDEEEARVDEALAQMAD